MSKAWLSLCLGKQLYRHVRCLNPSSACGRGCWCLRDFARTAVLHATRDATACGPLMLAAPWLCMTRAKQHACVLLTGPCHGGTLGDHKDPHMAAAQVSAVSCLQQVHGCSRGWLSNEVDIGYCCLEALHMSIRGSCVSLPAGSLLIMLLSRHRNQSAQTITG
jgi:hypothetical protein